MSVAALSFALNLLLLVPAVFMLQVFDRVLSSHSGETLLVLLLGTGLALLLLFLLDNLRSRLQGVASNILAEALSPAITRIAIAQGALRTGRPGNDALRDIGTLRSLFSAQGLLAAFDAPWLLAYVAVIWLAHPALGMAAAAAAALMLVLACLNDLVTRKGIETVRRQASEASRYLESSLASAEVAQVLGMAGTLVARWQERNREAGAAQRTLAARSVAMAAVTRTMRQAVQVGMLALGAWLVISGEASSGVMIATTVLLGRALAPVEQVVGSWRILAEGAGAYRRLKTLVDGAGHAGDPLPLPAPEGVLSASQLVLRIPGSQAAIVSGISLHLEAGQSLAIIGPSGAGKSTLLRLLTGVWKADAGQVRLDKADLSQWPREQVGPWIGYVPQDVELFPGTVAENIARMQRGDPEQVFRAARRAQVHDMILGLPQGYDTRVEPGSAMISPGQRQRIALARALYGDPKLLLLDEPNSNLDGEGEAALARCLAELRGQVTVVLVTHRSTLVQHVDQILVVEAGRTLHYGPAAEVLRAMQQDAQQKGVRVLDVQRSSRSDTAAASATQGRTS
jgi:PrtD family type I secretion system ABC transporter